MIVQQGKVIEQDQDLLMQVSDWFSFDSESQRNLPKIEKTPKTIVHGFVNFGKKMTSSDLTETLQMCTLKSFKR